MKGYKIWSSRLGGDADKEKLGTGREGSTEFLQMVHIQLQSESH